MCLKVIGGEMGDVISRMQAAVHQRVKAEFWVTAFDSLVAEAEEEVVAATCKLKVTKRLAEEHRKAMEEMQKQQSEHSAAFVDVLERYERAKMVQERMRA